MTGGAPDWWVIGNPGNRRVHLFQAALQQAGLAPARCVSYQDFLDRGPAALEEIAPGSVVRLESPGECFPVEQRILALGGVAGAMALTEERGRIHHPGRWFAGFTRLMAGLRQALPQVRWFNHPDDIVTLFDKPCCKALLAPHTLPPCPTFASAAAFRTWARAQPRGRFFVKLNYASSASGILAYDHNRRSGEELAYSTVERVPTPQGAKYFNSLKIARYRDGREIGAILDFLFAQGALVEPWIPKAAHAGMAYDLRVLAIAGQRQHAIARLSRSPMTNLHLGNRRCPVEALELDEARWRQIDTLVAQTMAHFPRSLYAGLDVLLPRHGGAPVLLEANAFGDLLPELKHQGRCTYQAEIAAFCARNDLGLAA